MPAMPDLPASSRGAFRSRGDPAVEAELRRRIAVRSRITFAEFMEVALYLPDSGYYERHVELGRAGDFLTSPETHPIFGALLSQLALLMWRALGSPESFRAIEYGAGTGSLCRQFVESTPHFDTRFAEALRYEIVERSAFLRALQQANLIDLTTRVTWLHPDAEPEPAQRCVIANEVVDALPVHRLRQTEAGLVELHVSTRDGSYVESEGPLSRPELAAYLRDENIEPATGSIVEICLAARDWITDAARRLDRGYCVTIDFGGEASALYRSPTPRSGLKCFHQHGWTDDPFDRPGLLDITAPVDFTNLKRVGAEVGLAPMLETSQGPLLQQLGLPAALERLKRPRLPADQLHRNRTGMAMLADPHGLGAFRVLVQTHDAPHFALEPASPGGEWFRLLPADVAVWPQ
jgi:SAM-dependent MidA family methyltransferase